MATTALPAVKAALTRERRTNRRLRALLDENTEQIQRLRHDLDVQFTRLAQLQAQLDARQERQSRGDRRGLDAGIGFPSQCSQGSQPPIVERDPR